VRRVLPVLLAALAAGPWLYLRLIGFHGSPALQASLSGAAVLGAAFLLSWAAELARLDISDALAVALLSFVAVLPEYAVDIYFAWQAGKDPAYAPYAVANMTGANRLLIGVGWTSVVLVHRWRTRGRILRLAGRERLELGALTLATLYAAVIPFKGRLSLLDTAVLFLLFVLYIRSASVRRAGEPKLIGPAAAMALLPPTSRRLVAAFLFAFAGGTILLSAEGFSEGLVRTGRLLGVDEFFLVQWLAPLASEAPEFIIALLFALQGRANLGLRTMISSKVNQWTLLVGMLPLAFAVSSGNLGAMPLDSRQVSEILLTMAQSFFAMVILARLEFPVWAALALFGLFSAQFTLPALHPSFTGLYFFLAFALLLYDPDRARALGRAMDDLTVRDHPAQRAGPGSRKR
jgi:cation:H+ antiporter